jgi:hypothetical protein
MAYKQKGFPMHAGTSVSPMKRDTGDVLTKNISNTNQKGDEQIKAKIIRETTSKKIGPAESPEAIDKKKDAHFDAVNKIKAGAKKGDSFETYMGEGPASDKTRKEVDEALAYQ